MFAKVYSASLLGLECKPIEIEVDYCSGLSYFTIVGLGDKAIQESKERIATALKNANIGYVSKRITINLAPANLAKSGSNFDLGIAAGLLLAMGKISFEPGQTAFLGELALDGSLRPIKGALPLIHGLQQLGFKQVIYPSQNFPEIQGIDKIKLVPIDSLVQLISYFEGKYVPNERIEAAIVTESYLEHDMAFVREQVHPKRAMKLAAISNSHLLLKGAPGVGKSMLAKCMRDIMPSLSNEHKFEVAKIYSVTGEETEFISSRVPFRAPHHSSTRAALIGGGNIPSPGEVTLAHRGILFLDELPEFTRNTLESLRQPIEDGTVTISRANFKVHYPARFVLLAAMNMCKCGNWGADNGKCICSATQVSNYQNRISGPLLDRIGLHVYVGKVDHLDTNQKSYRNQETSKQIKQQVELAQIFFAENYGYHPTLPEASQKQLDLQKYFPVAMRALKTLADNFRLSVRAYQNTLKVALTISALEHELLNKQHVAEALTYRPNNSK